MFRFQIIENMRVTRTNTPKAQRKAGLGYIVVGLAFNIVGFFILGNSIALLELSSVARGDSHSGYLWREGNGNVIAPQRSNRLAALKSKSVNTVRHVFNGTRSNRAQINK